MKFSYKQLQTHFNDALPEPEVLVEALTFHVFEIESIEKNADDIILDIKVLPDRACYAKSYEGIAQEVSTILGLKRKNSQQAISHRTIAVRPDQINEVLGADISKEEIISILSRMDIAVKENNTELILAIPENRQDLQTWRDIPEEIGRIYGYDKIEPILPKNTTFKPQVEKTFYYAEKIKNLLTEKGFSEVYTYSLVPKGVYEIEKPLAADKNYLRTNLSDGIVGSLELNARNADLLGLDEIKIFEIGKVFAKEGEYTSLAIGVRNVKKSKEKAKDKIKIIRDHVLETLEVNTTVLCTIDDTGGIISLNNESIGQTNAADGIMEINLDKLIRDLPQPVSYTDLNFGKAVNTTYKKISAYPFIVRDIAVFVPESIQSEEVWSVIETGMGSAGKELLARNSLFDAFKKDGKVSYAFRIVFQSMEKTLTDDEVNTIMEMVNKEVKGKGWEVR